MSALEVLSDYCGIVASFVDARGETQAATLETRQAVLAAMGVDGTDEARARTALLGLQAQEAAQCLPPVHVHYAAAGTIEVVVNFDTVPHDLHWRLELEDGRAIRGRESAEAMRTRRRLRIEGDIPCGYHTIALEPTGARCSLIVTPGQCWLPDGVDAGRRLWGIAIQLYLLRSEANWGIGDYGDLERLVKMVTPLGADVVGVNPLHAMFPDEPEQASPYSPASRLLLNVLNIDVEMLLTSMDCAAVRERVAFPHFQHALAQVREARLLDYLGVAALKLPILQALFDCCDPESDAWRSFIAFRETAGPDFERSCLFLALRKRFAEQSAALSDWHRWPEEYRTPNSAAALRFSQENPEAVTFQAWLQYIADSQLKAVCDAASGMAVGLYRDLAVGAHLNGAETWANPAAVVAGAHVGAPPDIYNPQGQDWGLPPFNPRALRAEGYRSFIELLRANMRHAGGLRIDHVMALQQLYWVPAGRTAAEGAYVRYPLEDLLGILALESQRHECLVVGEDLGTVPEGFRERMERANVLSYRVLFFEKNEHGFIPPDEYPRLALAVAGSHDLPTLRAWWQASDLSLKERLALFPTRAQAEQAVEERKADRKALGRLLQNSGLLDKVNVDADHFARAAHALLARTRSALTMLQIDDLTGEVDPVNVPTTSDEHPNWRRRISLSLERLSVDPDFRATTAEVAGARLGPGARLG